MTKHQQKHQQHSRDYLALWATTVAVICLITGTCVAVNSCYKTFNEGLNMIIYQSWDQPYESDSEATASNELNDTEDKAILLLYSIPWGTRLVVCWFAGLGVIAIPFLVTTFVIDALRNSGQKSRESQMSDKGT